ncbi:MAG: PAS domain S-box protein [Rhodobacteraceae bacterium]|nr:PAS domain S-box protein [Paracoccaceae bacterium]
MSSVEQLREALLELKSLRDREARRAEETRILLYCVEAFSAATTPEGALAALFQSLGDQLGFTTSLVARALPNGRAEIVACNDPRLTGQAFKAPVDLFSRTRNVIDLTILGDWEGCLPIHEHTGMIASPNQPDTVLVGFHSRRSGFGRETMDLMDRLSGLSVQALTASEIAAEKDLLAAAIAGSSSGFAIADAQQPEKPLVYVNRAFEEISGYTADKVLGQNCRFLSALAKDDPESDRLREATRTNAAGQFLIRDRRESGDFFWNELVLFPVEDGQGNIRHLVATHNDVTERVEAEKERDRLRARIRQALQATYDAFLVLDKEHKVSVSNAAVREFFPSPEYIWQPGSHFAENWAGFVSHAFANTGQSPNPLSLDDLLQIAQDRSGLEYDLPDGRSLIFRASPMDEGGIVVTATDVTRMKSAQRLLSQRLAAIEAATDGIAVTNDLSQFVYMNSTAAKQLGLHDATSGLGQRWTSYYGPAPEVEAGQAFEMMLSRSSEGAVFTHEVSGSPLEDGGSVLVIRDLTEKLEIEHMAKTLQRDLFRLQGQETAAQLTAGLAHDFNNLLATINGSATLMQIEPRMHAALQPHVDRIKTAGAQAAKMVNRMLDLGLESDSDGVFAVSSALKDVEDLLLPSLPSSVTLCIEDASDPLSLSGTPNALSQVVLNLALNGCDAIGSEQGELKITTYPAPADLLDQMIIGRKRPNVRYMAIEVADTGSGIDAAHLGNVFDPTFSTKGRKGTGLGLSMVAMQVQSVGGGISISSQLGSGTQITVFWPVARVENSIEDYTSGPDMDLAGMSIIVVDDDKAVGEVVSQFLEAKGAEVVPVTDARDAIAAIEDAPQEWSALVTDYDMPIMTGGELVERIGKVAPDLPIVVVTALARRLTDPRLEGANLKAVLPKPLELTKLAKTLEASKVSL